MSIVFFLGMLSISSSLVRESRVLLKLFFCSLNLLLWLPIWDIRGKIENPGNSLPLISPPLFPIWELRPRLRTVDPIKSCFPKGIKTYIIFPFLYTNILL